MPLSLETTLVSSLTWSFSINLAKHKNFHGLLVVLAFYIFCVFTSSTIGAIFLATDSICTLQVLSQYETPFLDRLHFGEGVVNDATSVVLFNAIQNFDLRAQ